jgi:hypothetical protein
MRPGRHLTAQTIMKRLRSLGINPLGARNTALQSLAVEVSPPLVAALLGYSYTVIQRHAEIAVQPWAGYVKAHYGAIECGGGTDTVAVPIGFDSRRHDSCKLCWAYCAASSWVSVPQSQ